MFMTICWNGRQNGYFDKTAGMENFVVLYIYIYIVVEIETVGMSQCKTKGCHILKLIQKVHSDGKKNQNEQLE